MKLKELKLTDIAGKKFDVIFPIGATEQHGPFAPFGTDTYITEYLVDAIEKEFPNLVILPMLEFSRSGEHRGFPGTLWLTEETMYAVMADIVRSVEPWANSISFMSFHASDSYFEKFVAESQSQLPMRIISIFDSADDNKIEDMIGGVLDGHGGNTEISNILYLHPELAQVPPSDYPKPCVSDAFSTDNLIDFVSDGIVDENPKWNVSKEIGQATLEIYRQRVLQEIANKIIITK